MAKLITLKFSTIGGTTGPFDIYTDVDLVNPLYTGVTKTDLLNGITISIPDNATYVKIISTGICGTEIILPLMTPTPTVTPTQTATSTPTPSPSNSPTPTPSASPTLTPTNTPPQTQVPSRTPRPTASPTPTVTGPTPTPTNTTTPSPTPSETPKVSNTPVPTPNPTNTTTPSPTPSETPKVTIIFSGTPTPTASSTPVSTPTPTPTSTDRFIITLTPFPTPTPTPTSNVPTSTPGVTFRVTETPTPTPTISGPTPTPAGTGATPVPTNPPIPTCAPIYNTFDGNIYFYDVLSKTSTLLNYSPKIESHDIAHSQTKLFLIDDFLIYEYDLTPTTFTATFVRTISYPTGFLTSKGLFLKNETTIVVGEQSLNPTRIYEMDITTIPPSLNFKFSLPNNRIISGDFIITTGDKLIVTTQDLINGAFITQYDYNTGVIEFDINITSDCPYPWGIFQYDNKIYISNGNLGDIFQMELVPPFTRTFYDRTNIGWFGASQTNECLPNEFSGTTPTPTLTPTPTPTPTRTTTPTPTITPSPSPTQSPIDCDPIYNTTSGNVYRYDVLNRRSILLNVPQVINSFDIAHTNNKLWVYDRFNFVEYDLVVSPWDATINRIEPWPTGFEASNGLCALDDFHLVTSNVNTNPNVIVELSLLPVSVTNRITLPVDREIYGDLIISSDRRCFVLTKETTGALNSYLSIYNYSTGTLINEINITSTIPNPSAIFVYNNQFYVVNNNGVEGDVYIVELTAPYTITYYDTTPREWQGASQIPECILQPTPTPTPSPTILTTPTPTPNLTNRPTATPTPTPTSTCAVTLCINDCGCDELPCIINANNIKTDPSSPINSFYDVLNNLYNGFDLPNDDKNIINVAHTITKVWKTNGVDKIYEWLVTGSTTELSLNREIIINSNSFPNVYHSGLFAIDDNTLLTSSGPESNSYIYRLDITNDTVDISSSTQLFLLENQRDTGVESMIYTQNGKIIVIERRRDIPYVTQYDYLTGAIDVEVSLEHIYTGDTSLNFYIFQAYSNFYISAGKSVYKLNKYYPYETSLFHTDVKSGVYNSALYCNTSGLTIYEDCPIFLQSGNSKNYFWDPATNTLDEIFLPNDSVAVNVAVTRNKIFKYYGGPDFYDYMYVKEWDYDLDTLSATFVKTYDRFKIIRRFYNRVFGVHNDSTIVLNNHVIFFFSEYTYDCPLPLSGTIITEPNSEPRSGGVSVTDYPPYPSARNFSESLNYAVPDNGIYDILITNETDRLLSVGTALNVIDSTTVLEKQIITQHNYLYDYVEFKKELPFRATGVTQFWGYVYLFGNTTGSSETFVYKLEVDNPDNLVKLDLPSDFNVTAVSSIRECQNYKFESNVVTGCQEDLPMPCCPVVEAPQLRNLPFLNETIPYGGDPTNPYSIFYYSISGYGFGDITRSTLPITACTCNKILPEIPSNAIKLGTTGPYQYIMTFINSTQPIVYLAIYNISPNEEITFTGKQGPTEPIDFTVQKVRNFSCFTSVSGTKITGDSTMSCVGGGLYKLVPNDPHWYTFKEVTISGSGGSGGIYVAYIDNDLRDYLPILCDDTDPISEGSKMYNGIILTSEFTGRLCPAYYTVPPQCGNLFMSPTKFGLGCGGFPFTYTLKFSEYVNNIILLFAVFNDGDTTYFTCDSGPITVRSIYHCNVTPIGNSIVVDGCCSERLRTIGGIFQFSSTLPYTSLTISSTALGWGYTIRIDCGSVIPYNPNLPTPTPMATPPPTQTPAPTGILTDGYTIYKHFGKIGDSPAPTLPPPSYYTIYKNFDSQ